MSAIKSQIPLLPASIEYLELYYKNFNYFIEKYKLSKPISLSIKPSQFYKLNNYIESKKNKINHYQGKMINYDYLKTKQQNRDLGRSRGWGYHRRCARGALSAGGSICRMSRTEYLILAYACILYGVFRT